MDMAEKFRLDSEYSASVTCPKCMRSFKIDLSRLENSMKQVRIKCNCPCGNSFPIILDRRRHERKKTRLTGAYIHDKKKARGLIKIVDLSRSGIGFESSSEHRISRGDILTVRFNLDDAFNTLISKEILTKRINKNFVGNEFLDIIWDHDLLYLYIEQYLT
jgi:hypothetical protein